MFKVLYRCEDYPIPPTIDRDWKVLGALYFAQAAESHAGDRRAVRQHVAMRVLGNGAVAHECFCESASLRQAQHEDIHYRYSDEVLFGVLALHESAYAACNGSPLQTASSNAYEQIFAVLKKENFPYALRFWNYIADINGTTHGLERYRQFNLGRQQAFDNRGTGGKNNLPAACALGARNGPLTIAFLAGRSPSLPVENPRQVSAYDYPVQYGPRSPLFSRAGIATIGGKRTLFLSGTASIVGHATLHVGNVAAQTEESIANIAAVLSEADSKAKTACRLADLDYIVYIRNEKDFQTVRTVLEQRIGPDLKAFYLQADICRSDLLVEIEGAAQLRS